MKESRHFLHFLENGESNFQLLYLTRYGFEYEMQKCSSPSITPRYILSLLSTFSLFVKKGESRFQLCYMKKYGFEYGEQNCSSSSTTTKYFICLLSTFSRSAKKEKVVSNFVIWRDRASSVECKNVPHPRQPPDSLSLYFLLSLFLWKKEKVVSNSVIWRNTALGMECKIVLRHRLLSNILSIYFLLSPFREKGRTLFPTTLYDGIALWLWGAKLLPILENPQIHYVLTFYFLPFRVQGESRFQLLYMKRYGFEYGEQKCFSPLITPKYTLISTFFHFAKKEKVVSNFVIWRNIALSMRSEIVQHLQSTLHTLSAYFLLSPFSWKREKVVSNFVIWRNSA